MDIKEFRGRLADRTLTRRQFSKTLGAAGVGLAMMPVGSRLASAAPADQGTYFAWGSYGIPEFFVPYIKKHGEPPNYMSFGGSEEALTKMRAGFVVDVAHPCNQGIPRWIASGLFQPIDTSKLSNWGDLVPTLTNLPGAVTDGKQYFAPMDWGQTSITYRTDLVDLEGQEESWGMLWDERYKGRLGMIGSAGDSWWCAAILAGVDFTEIATPENIKKVGELLRKQRPLIRFYSDDMTSLAQALSSGEMVAAMTWTSASVKLKKQGVPVAFANPKEGALTWVCGAMIHKDAPHIGKAHDIVDSLLSVDTGKHVIGQLGYGHSNTKSFDLFSDDELSALGLSRNPNDILDAGKFQIPQTQEFETTINKEFEGIKAGF